MPGADFIRRLWRTRSARVMGVAAVVLVAVLLFLSNRGTESARALTFEARRGPLSVRILEGGSLEALESQDFKCEVRGYQGVKILRIVEEGYQVTPEDVKGGKVLVELDSSELRKQITQQEIQFQSTVAALIDAQQSHKIQIDQNRSDVSAAEQKARFARMDLCKFMGSKAAEEIIGRLGIDESARPVTASPDTGAEGGASPGEASLGGVSDGAESGLASAEGGDGAGVGGGEFD